MRIGEISPRVRSSRMTRTLGPVTGVKVKPGCRAPDGPGLGARLGMSLPAPRVEA